MAIPQSVIDHVLSRIDLAEIIGSRIKLKKAGKSFVGCCPFHQEKTPSFHVSREKGSYYCFGCHAKGNAINFIMEHDKREFIDVLSELAQKSGVELPKSDQPDITRYHKAIDNPTPPAIRDKSTAAKPNKAQTKPAEKSGDLNTLVGQLATYFEEQLAQYAPAQHYLRSRGLNAETLKFWRLGYAPASWDHLITQFPQDIEGLEILGLIKKSDDGSRSYCLLRDRIIFPIRSVRGHVVGFAGRALQDDVKPKYINSPESPIFHKGELLYGLYESLRSDTPHWLMVEGYLDVISLYQQGIHGAVAPMGTATNSDQLQRLFRHKSKIILAFDGDIAGQNASWKSMELALPILQDSYELRFLILPAAHDPDSMIKLEGKTAFESRIEHAIPLSEYLFAKLETQFNLQQAEGKANLLASLQPLIAQLPETGSYRRLLQQFFREKFGLIWQKPETRSVDQLLNFSVASLEDKLLVMLLHHPSFIDHIGPLQELISDQHTLHTVCNLIGQNRTMLDALTSPAYIYLVASWPEYESRGRIIHLLEHLSLGELNLSTEHSAELVELISLKLQEKYLVQTQRTLTLRDHNRKTINDQLQHIRGKLQSQQSSLDNQLLMTDPLVADQSP